MEHREDGITYHRYALGENESVTPEFIEIYRKIFEDPPWNEFKKCPACIQPDGNPLKFSRGDVSALPSYVCGACGSTPVPYFSDEDIANDIRNALRGKSPSCHFVRHNGRLIGFCYGCEYSYEELEHDLKLSGVARGLRNAFGDQRVAYQDEIAVDTAYRGSGYARELFHRRQQDFLNSGVTLGVVRTQTHPPSVTYKWYVRYDYAIVAAYGDKGGRVVLARDLTTLNMRRA